MSLALKPRFKKFEVDYHKNIEQITATLVLSYIDGVTPKAETLASDIETPDWLSPPDLKSSIIFPDVRAYLANNWSRLGSQFTKATVNITSIDNFAYTVDLLNAWSTQSVKVINPFAYTMKVDIFSVGGIVGGQISYYVREFSSLEIDISAFTNFAKNDGASTLRFVAYIYNQYVAGNYMQLISATTFQMGFPTVEPSTGVPYGPTFVFNENNEIDKWGLDLVGLAAAFSGIELGAVSLTRQPVIAKMAEAMAIPVGTMVGIFALALYNKWISISDIADYIAPILLGTAGPAAIAWTVERATSKYTDLIGSSLIRGLGGVGQAGLTGAIGWSILSVVDDVEVSLLC